MATKAQMKKPAPKPTRPRAAPKTELQGRISNAPPPQPGRPGWVNLPDRRGFVPTPRVPAPVADGRMYAGGTPNFNEAGPQWQPFDQTNGWGTSTNPKAQQYKGTPGMEVQAKQINAWTDKPMKTQTAYKAPKAPKAPKW